MGTSRAAAVLPLLLSAAAVAGCVRRTITITTDPPGTLVWLNDRELGRTPVETDFVFYGTYDVRLEHPDREPLSTSGRAEAPWWQFVGLDLVAELLPVTLHDRVRWHYALPPADDDPDAVVERARAMRQRLEAEAQPATGEQDAEGGP